MQSSLVRIVAILAFITAAAYLAVETAYKTVTPVPSPEALVSSVYQAEPPVAEAGKQTRADYGVIVERNLFGSTTAEEISETKEIDVDALEYTELDLVLLGTVAGSNGEISYAVIGDRSGREQELYREGDEVAGARLVKIMRTKVVLRVEDRDEVLAMENDMDGARSAPAGKAWDQRRSGTGASASGEAVVLKRSEVDAAVRDMGRLMTDARLRPFFSGGDLDGVAISNIVSGSIFQKLGLRNGDVIREIDGRALRSPEDILNVYRNLESGSEVTVNIKRRGREELLQYRFED